MISVVIPLYNKQNAVRRTLNSVLEQSFADFEVLIIDDGSTDESLEIVKHFASKDARIKVIAKNNGGVCSARNKGIEAAQYDYVALLDADDVWDKDYLLEQRRMINDFPEAAMWGINFAEMSDGRQLRVLKTGLPEYFRGYVDNYFQIKGRVSDLFCSSSVVIRKAVFSEVGLFDERIRYSEDNDMWYRIIATHRVAFYDRYMVFYIYDAENRALSKRPDLKYDLMSFVDKYNTPIYKKNTVFYRYINSAAAVEIRDAYFGNDKQQREVACSAAQKLDYDAAPFKYRLYYKLPFVLGKIAYIITESLRDVYINRFRSNK